ncbi:hypothetical protein BpHYR1_016813 [Brachionus plicatilis]|uniref:Uncharacterized protein n=1 Tax=Brachionus plicatilis TaxID=10195 RepID=A0A3M7PX50_BRAPC|nr:hypothetical protein BpHYR1_016813 [Brachionus plicatilis]
MEKSCKSKSLAWCTITIEKIYDQHNYLINFQQKISEQHEFFAVPVKVKYKNKWPPTSPNPFDYILWCYFTSKADLKKSQLILLIFSLSVETLKIQLHIQSQCPSKKSPCILIQSFTIAREGTTTPSESATPNSSAQLGS